jgi:hypothetical protein
MDVRGNLPFSLSPPPPSSKPSELSLDVGRISYRENIYIYICKLTAFVLGRKAGREGRNLCCPLQL